MIQVIGWLSAFATLLTGVALLQDMLRVPPRKTPLALYTHYSRAFLLVGVSSLSGLLVIDPYVMSASAYEVALRVFLACSLMRATPHPWLEYVFTDRFRFTKPTRKLTT